MKKILITFFVLFIVFDVGLAAYFFFISKSKKLTPKQVAEKVEQTYNALPKSSDYKYATKRIRTSSEVSNYKIEIVNPDTLYKVLDRMGVWKTDGFATDLLVRTDNFDPATSKPLEISKNFRKITLTQLEIVLSDFEHFKKKFSKNTSLLENDAFGVSTYIEDLGNGSVKITFFLPTKILLSQTEKDLTLRVSDLFFTTMWDHTHPGISFKNKDQYIEFATFARKAYFPFIKVTKTK